MSYNNNYSGTPTTANGISSPYSSSSTNSRHYKSPGSNHKSAHSSDSSRYHNSSSTSQHDYESRNQSLTQQLATVQSQVLRLDTELSNVRTAKSHAEHRFISLQQEFNQLQRRNSEVIEVMKTLEIGVEALQREKTALAVERDELKAKLEASEKNSAILTEQVSYLNERNSTLSKKCVDLLDGSKEYREKATTYEEELQRLKPRYAEMESQFGALNEQNRTFSTRLNMYEMRERIWIREKTEMDERRKLEIENWQKMVAGLRQKHEVDLAQLRQGRPGGGGPLPVQQQMQRNFQSISVMPPVNGPSKADMEKMEQHIKGLQLLLDIIQKHHNTELEHYQRRIEQLEKVVTANHSQKNSETDNKNKHPGCTGNQNEEEECLLDEDSPSELVLKSEVNQSVVDALLDDDNSHDDIIVLDNPTTTTSQFAEKNISIDDTKMGKTSGEKNSTGELTTTGNN